jgi:hypothetical protein
MHGIALNITVESYERNLDFGLMADAKAVPDVRDLAQGLHQAMDELRAMQARDDEAGARPRQRTAAKARRSKATTSKVAARKSGAAVQPQREP